MKKYFLIAAAACLLLSGCGGNGESTQAPAAEASAAQQQDTRKLESSLPEQPKPLQPGEVDNGWRKAYRDIILGSGAKRFSLPLIDNDETPELVLYFSELNQSAHADSPHLYVYTGGTVTDLGEQTDGGWDTFGYYERKGIVVASFMSTGSGQQTYQRLEHGSLVTEHEVSTTLLPSDDGAMEYTIDGVAATKADADALADQYDKSAYKTSTGDHPAEDAASVLGIS